MYNVDTYFLAFILTALLILGLMFQVWGYHRVLGVRWLLFMMVALLIWLVFSAFRVALVPLDWKIWCSRLAYFGIVMTPVFFYRFSIEFSQMSPYKPPPYFPMIYLVPIITIIMAFTNDFHFLLWKSINYTKEGILWYGYGPWYWVFLCYSYLLVATGMYKVVKAMYTFPAIYRVQGGIFLLGSSIPLLGNVLEMLHVISQLGKETTPLYFSWLVLSLTWVVRSHKFVELIPLSREKIFHLMQDSIVITDVYDHVIDFNYSAKEKFDISYNNLGHTIAKVIGIPEYWLSEIYDREYVQMNLHDRYVEVCRMPITESGGKSSGYSWIFRDISSYKKIELYLRETNLKLQDEIHKNKNIQEKLQEQANRDALTGAFNRRYLQSTLEPELRRAVRNKTPISLWMFDLDHFKSVNDTYGHAAGDYVLQYCIRLLGRYARSEDICYRYGGEEFVLVLPNMPLHLAVQRAEMYREMLAQNPVIFLEHSINITVSIGVAALPWHAYHAEALLQYADEALYKAKTSGRNRVYMAEIDNTHFEDEV